MQSAVGIRRAGRISVGMVLCLCATLWSDQPATQTAPAEAKKTAPGLQDAINARTEAAILQENTRDIDPRIRRMLRNLSSRADNEMGVGNNLLAVERYAQSIESFQKAGRMFQEIIDGRKTLQAVAAAYRQTQRARMTAEAAGAPEAARDEVRRQELNAEGFIEFGDFARAQSEFVKARQGYEALFKTIEPGTLELAVQARTAMLEIRKRISAAPRFESEPEDPLEAFLTLYEGRMVPGPLSARQEQPRRGSFNELIQRARATERCATEALQARDYGPARLLFEHAGKLYTQLAAMQDARNQAVMAENTAREAMRKADALFHGQARPTAHARGQEALADGRKAMQDEDIDKAAKLFAEATALFQEAQNEAQTANALVKAREAWASAQAGKDPELLNRHCAQQAEAARKKGAQADELAAGGMVDQATRLYLEATHELNDAAAEALSKDNVNQAQPLLKLLEDAIKREDKFGAESLLTEVSRLLPKAEVTDQMRARVAALPWPKDLSVELEPGVSLEFVLIPAGKFLRGSTLQPDEKPVAEVTISRPFYLGKYEVTQAQWRAVMTQNPSRFPGRDNPVEKVSWNDCQMFLQRLSQKIPERSFRLPSEAEWEYACRAGTTGRYFFGDDVHDLDAYAWYADNAGARTRPVGQKKPNPWGLYDMLGNVWEWCEDMHVADVGYLGAPTDGSARVSGGSHSARVLRGGSWISYGDACRCAVRIRWRPSDGLFYHGFRVVAGPR